MRLVKSKVAEIVNSYLIDYPAPSNLEIHKYLRETMKKKRNSFHRYGNMHKSHNTYLQRNSSENTLKPLVFLVEFSDESQIYEWQINPNTRKYSENTAAPTLKFKKSATQAKKTFFEL